MRELASVGQLVKFDFSSEQHGPSLQDVRATAEPHLPILVHKRGKASGNGHENATNDPRWLAELHRLALRWTHLAANDRERARLISLLDHVVGEEQQRLAEQVTAIPVTSRFDTSWAT